MSKSHEVRDGHRAALLAGFLGWTFVAFDLLLVVVTLTSIARRVVRVASRRIRRWLSSRRDLFVNRASSLGLATTLLHRRPSCIFGSLCEISRKGVGGLEKHSARELGSIGTRDCFALET